MALSLAEVGALGRAVRMAHGRCLDKALALEQFVRDHPDVDVRLVRAASLAVDRCPWPSVDGNPPVYRDRPYYDARLHDQS